MDIEKFLADFVRTSTQHRRFYHFTDQSNIGSIRTHGLLSTQQLRQKNLLKDVATGGDANSLATDAAKGTDQYVCLCFTTGHPMQYIARTQRGLNPVYLHISPEVLKFPGVMITNAASNQHGVVRVSAAEALDGLDLDVLYKRTDWKLPEIQTRLQAAEKYEILIPDRVPVEAIIHGL
ncbi:DarT ssDNA thymidine ADP-ribosyltransferase family protein [Tardiphaga sp. 20_F10_N6_6]|uniref:DarT ssDNA thymidine ADP-ribosyltransferase family protein n=1 Tax=Tardiphaga sp. 20_F10_N6_6 TaxID=3240788 RepID=UPI003F8B0159